VDYPTQQRIPKESAHWYKSVIAENAVTTRHAAAAPHE
jgi:beta-glucosidase/6-phospho-beta-glucosidase/beta-galactosidase